MKKMILLLLFYLTLSADSLSCKENSNSLKAAIEMNDVSRSIQTKSIMKIKIGSHSFAITLDDNATVTAFKKKLPMTADMVELNGNEKYFDMPNNLPQNATHPGTIQYGDLMLYGSSTLVLFYKSFATPYSYTRVGRINDPKGLAAALGSGNVRVTYQLE